MSEKAVEGLQKLRTASLLLIIGTLVAAVPAILVPAATPFAIAQHPLAAFAALGVVLVAALLGLVLILVAVFAYLLPAFNALREHSSEKYGTPAKLVKIGYLYGLIVVLAGLALLIAAAAAKSLALIGVSMVLLVAGGLMALAGFVGIIIGFIRLRDEYGETLFLVAAILLIIGIFIPILQFIAWILAYIAAGSALKKAST